MPPVVLVMKVPVFRAEIYRFEHRVWPVPDNPISRIFTNEIGKITPRVEAEWLPQNLNGFCLIGKDLRIPPTIERPRIHRLLCDILDEPLLEIREVERFVRPTSH